MMFFSYGMGKGGMEDGVAVQSVLSFLLEYVMMQPIAGLFAMQSRHIIAFELTEVKENTLESSPWQKGAGELGYALVDSMCLPDFKCTH